MFEREIPCSPTDLTRIANRRQVEGKETTLGDIYRSGTFPLWEKARDLVDEFLFGRQRQVLVLFLARKTFSEIAVILGMSRGSVTEHYRRAIKTLKQVSAKSTTSGEVSAA